MASEKAIEKKLKQIVELEEKKAKGEALNEDQQAKLQNKKALQQELERLRKGGAPAAAPAAPVPQAAPVAATAPAAPAEPEEAQAPEEAPAAAEAAPAPAAEEAPAMAVVEVAAVVEAAKPAAPATKKAIEKKLRQITEIEEKKAKGESLNDDQVKKLAMKKELQVAMKTAV
mmetsp:Transcript_23368/g.79171  ORF Transcript_23368/g.79171 Transcript_23368/m.79171 type:complete len:172 (-) Transcript_23368:180-695(-)